MAALTDRQPIRRALISVYDKRGLEDLARGLHDAGVQLVSTGSTARLIDSVGVPVTEVSEVTGFQECLGGRVKTLHPRVHAGILADRRDPQHVQELGEMGIEPFDLVVVNLYPFVQTVRSGASSDEVIEQIDIGGPSMLRAAAKNHASCAVVVDPEKYPQVVRAAKEGGFDLCVRRRLASLAFAHTAAYDNAVAQWTAQQFGDGEKPMTFPPYAGLALERAQTLRYGENPHQAGAMYVDHTAEAGIAQAEQLHGKPMSYNNYVDADAAIRAAYDFSTPAVAIIKHANPCGIATVAEDGEIVSAYIKAHACDPVSAFGGVVASNRIVDRRMAEALAPVFTEVVVAPGFEPGAVEVLSAKKNLRLLVLPEAFRRDPLEMKQISGGMLLQTADLIDNDAEEPEQWKLVAGPAATGAVLEDLSFAWRAVRAAKSNAILLAKDGGAVGVGMGQVNRLDSCRLAVERANTLCEDSGAQPVERARGAVAASDAFFPFADGLEILIDAGVTAVVQPGGSVRDEEVIQSAQEAGITMYYTGTRHFFH